MPAYSRKIREIIIVFLENLSIYLRLPGETQVNQHDITTPDLASVPQRMDILAHT